MTEEDILKSLNLSKNTWVLRTFPYNKLATQLNSKQQRICSDGIKTRGIRLLATISPLNTNIPKFEDEHVRFEEIHLFQIQVTSWKYCKDIYKIFAEIIPYPLLILFSHEDKYQWIIATHQKQENSFLLKIDKIYQSNIDLPIDMYLKRLVFQNMNTVDLKSYYDTCIKQIVDTELQEKYQLKTSHEHNEDLLEKLNQLEKEIFQLVNQAKKEKQMNKRIALQVEANKRKQQKKKLIEPEV
ncbi:DUF4391 domain-containing protein [Bacillus cereus group sp. BfR-BA-01314]|uniref:DUF4391 domain-containing protein n=1 Tax=Bacillus cereus group sp. BfR-BA-01314 TaxID=2920291 RepID=UPI001F56C16B